MFSKKGLMILLVGMLLLSCTACSGMESLTDGLKGGVKQFGDNVAIGKSKALITPYQSFDGVVPPIVRHFWLPMTQRWMDLMGKTY